MKFLIDAHLPKGIGSFFRELGHEVIHTSELPEGSASQDQDLIVLAMECYRDFKAVFYPKWC